MMKKFVLGAGLYSYFKYSQGDLQMATYDEMTSGDGLFNMIEAHPDNVIGLFDLMIAQEVDIDLNTKLVNLKANCVAYSNQESEPEPEPITPTCKTIEWRQGQDIVVNLLEPIETGASVTTWLTNEGFAPENMGRSVYVSDALKYTIRMSDKRGNGTIEVRVNDNNAQFELEVI